MSRPMTEIFDCSTGTRVKREMTDQEYSDHLAKIAESEALEAVEKPKTLDQRIDELETELALLKGK